MLKACLHGHAGVRFDVEGWNQKINIDIFEDPKNQRVFLDHKVPKKMFFTQSRLYMAMQGCILMSRFTAQKSM